jgi:hypothetical protein
LWERAPLSRRERGRSEGIYGRKAGRKSNISQ